MSEPWPVCPECKAGKHGNCDGIGDVNDNDEEIPCMCLNDLHKAEIVGDLLLNGEVIGHTQVSGNGYLLESVVTDPEVVAKLQTHLVPGLSIQGGLDVERS